MEQSEFPSIRYVRGLCGPPDEKGEMKGLCSPLIHEDKYLIWRRLMNDGAAGWSEVRTWQDAPYFGLYASQKARAILTYCEGDVTLQEFPSEKFYLQGLVEAVQYYKEGEMG